MIFFILFRDLKCKYVVSLLGVVTEGRKFMYVMELMEEKDLKTFLLNHPKKDLSDEVRCAIVKNLQRAP